MISFSIVKRLINLLQTKMVDFLGLLLSPELKFMYQMVLQFWSHLFNLQVRFEMVIIPERLNGIVLKNAYGNHLGSNGDVHYLQFSKIFEQFL